MHTWHCSSVSESCFYKGSRLNCAVEFGEFLVFLCACFKPNVTGCIRMQNYWCYKVIDSIASGVKAYNSVFTVSGMFESSTTIALYFNAKLFF